MILFCVIVFSYIPLAHSRQPKSCIVNTDIGKSFPSF
jgi:hypothetical protein